MIVISQGNQLAITPQQWDCRLPARMLHAPESAPWTAVKTDLFIFLERLEMCPSFLRHTVHTYCIILTGFMNVVSSHRNSDPVRYN